MALIDVHVHAAPADAFFVNSFILEGETSVVLVDTQFLVSTATALRRRLDAVGKPLAGVVVTHPHPDHYNGLPIVLEGRSGVPVYATAATRDGIAAGQAGKRATWTPVYGADYPTADGLPDHALASGEALRLGDVGLVAHAMGPGESPDMTVIELPGADALIASDLVYNCAHPWLAEERTDLWLAQLDQVEAQFGGLDRIFAGHGAPGGPELFAGQRDYITAFRAQVDARRQGAELSPDAVQAIVAATEEGRAGWPLAALIAPNAKAVAKELARAG